MKLVDQHAPQVGVASACTGLGVSRATWYRWRRRGQEPARFDRRRPPRRLSDDERDRVLEVLCCDRFIDRSPRAIYATLLDEGVYGMTLCRKRGILPTSVQGTAPMPRRILALLLTCVVLAISGCGGGGGGGYYHPPLYHPEPEEAFSDRNQREIRELNERSRQNDLEDRVRSLEMQQNNYNSRLIYPGDPQYPY